MKKEELIEMTIKYCVEDWDADEHDQKYLRAFFRAELSDNPKLIGKKLSNTYIISDKKIVLI